MSLVTWYPAGQPDNDENPTREDGAHHAGPTPGCAPGLGPGRHDSRESRVLLRQWNESPQAQELWALGLSMVNPCCSMVSMKSMVAPER